MAKTKKKAAAKKGKRDGVVRLKPGPRPSQCMWCDGTACTCCRCAGFPGCSHAPGAMCERPRYGRRLVCNPCEKHKLVSHRGPSKRTAKKRKPTKKPKPKPPAKKRARAPRKKTVPVVKKKDSFLEANRDFEAAHIRSPVSGGGGGGGVWGSPGMNQILQHPHFTGRSPQRLTVDAQRLIQAATHLHEGGILSATQVRVVTKQIADGNEEMKAALDMFDRDGGQRLGNALRRTIGVSRSPTGLNPSGSSGIGGNAFDVAGNPTSSFVNAAGGGGSSGGGASFVNAPLISTINSGSFVRLPGLPRLPSFGDLGVMGGGMSGGMGGTHHNLSWGTTQYLRQQVR